jgi:molybdenum cofactor guanylyltransferase
MEKHQKHTKLTKPNYGNFGRNEWAILGTPCGVIQKLAKELCKNIPPPYLTGYVDADHKAADEADTLPFCLEYTDKINYNRFDIQGTLTPFQYRSQFNEVDIVLINGNHFEGKRQIVVLDERKFESLSRKLNRLTQVDMFIILDTMDTADLSTAEKLANRVPPFLKNHLPNWADIPICKINDVAEITNHLIALSPISHLQSLILVGGKSTRMGRDKAQIDYHGKPQWAYMSEILRGLDFRFGMSYVSEIKAQYYVSCRFEQQENFNEVNIITDTFMDLGPYGAILSAFRENPNVAWLVVACDLPLLDNATLQYLIDNRNPSKIATTFKSPVSTEGFPEPLITIWEPKSYPILLQFLSQGISCPRKVLLNSDIELLDAPNPQALMNVNTVAEFEEVQKTLQ